LYNSVILEIKRLTRYIQNIPSTTSGYNTGEVFILATRCFYSEENISWNNIHQTITL